LASKDTCESQPEDTNSISIADILAHLEYAAKELMRICLLWPLSAWDGKYRRSFEGSQ